MLIWAARATVKAYQDGKYYIKGKLMRKLFEIVLQFQKRLSKEIQYSLGLHACYSEGIPYILWVLEGKVDFVKPLKFSKKMQA